VPDACKPVRRSVFHTPLVPVALIRPIGPPTSDQIQPFDRIEATALSR